MFVWDIPSDREGDDRERMMFEQLVAERATNDLSGSVDDQGRRHSPDCVVEFSLCEQ